MRSRKFDRDRIVEELRRVRLFREAGSDSARKAISSAKLILQPELSGCVVRLSFLLPGTMQLNSRLLVQIAIEVAVCLGQT